MRTLPVFLASALTIAAVDAQTPAPPPRRILFIGDSLTYFQNGIYTHLEKLAAAAHPPLEVTTDKSVFGGASLKRLWSLQEPVKAISAGGHDVVVLQEDLPETTVADFREYARQFVAEVRKHNARPILLMAWAYPRLGWISMAEIARAHRDVAAELSVEVAPVGLAWERASQERPQINLYGPDREHPSLSGTYLATCVVYTAIYGRDPGGIAYVPSGMTPEETQFLQRVAWQTLQGYRLGRLK